MGVDAGHNAAWVLLGSKLRSPWGTRPYLMTGQETWSYARLGEEVGRLSGYLARLGLQAGDRVVLVMGDRVAMVVGFWAALWTGMVAVPLAPVLAVPELRRIFLDCRPAVILTEPSAAKKVAVAAEGLSARLLVSEDPSPWQGCREASEAVPVEETALALLLYTSGTTGQMKGVAHTHANLLAAARGLGPQVLQLTPEDRVFSAARMFFAYGLGNSVYLPAASGAAAVVHPGPVLPGVVEEIFAHFRPTVFFAVPSLFQALSSSGAFPWGCLRLAVSAGEKLAQDLWGRLTQQMKVPVLDGLGMTETLHHFTSNRPKEVAPGSAGRPLLGFDLQVRGEDGRLLGEGEVGELWVRGPTLMRGYWGQPELTSRVLVEGWLRTGDMVCLRGGFVYTYGRRDELIKVGGLAVFPGEVEAVLRQHPAVAEVAVVPVPRGAGVVILKALVLPKPGALVQEAELYRFCRRRLASFKVPRLYELVPALPRTPTGKLLRRQLAPAAGEG